VVSGEQQAEVKQKHLQLIFPAQSDLSEKIYLTGLLLLAVALPFSNFLMSVAQFVLVAAWLLHGNYNSGFSRLLDNKSALLFIVFYCLHLIGLLYTVDFPAGLNDLRIKLPLLLLPFVMVTLPDIPGNMLRKILLAFVAGVLLQTIMISFNSGWIFISPIRFSMMVSISIFILLQESFLADEQWKKISAVVLAIWFAFFLVQFPYDTGIVTFACGLFVFSFLKVVQSKSSQLKLLFLFAIVALAASAVFFIYEGVKAFQGDAEMKPATEVFTSKGEKYVGYPERKEIENGNYVWRDIVWTELENAWNQRSTLAFKGNDSTGQPLHVTLIRFLTSKEMKKDAEAISKLSMEEIHAIEKGVANIRYMDGLNLSDRLYETMWSLYHYQIGNNPQGSSVTQRFEFWKAGWSAFLQSPFFGYGTGSVRSVINQQYEKMNSVLEKDFRLKTHNQYLATAVALGSVGLICLLLAFLFPVFYAPSVTYSLALVFLVITLAAMLVEDTLETQAGVTLVAFFVALLLLPRAVSLSSVEESEQDLME